MIERLSDSACGLRSFATLAAAALLACAWDISPAAAQVTTTITFDAWPNGVESPGNGTTIDDQFQAWGVTFSGGPTIQNVSDNWGTSGRSLRVEGPLRIDFSSPTATRVGLTLGGCDPSCRLMVFDSTDTMITSTGFVDTGVFGSMLLQLSGSGIAYAILEMHPEDMFTMVDNVVFDHPGPPPDNDMDGTPDALDECDEDPLKFEAGPCGCGMPDDDTDGDQVADCIDICLGDDQSGDDDQDRICNDRDDHVLVTASEFPGEVGPCTVGGVAITVGVDRNATNTLDGEEVTTTDYICTGPQGVPGLPVQFTSTELSVPNVDCPTGGVQIHFWVDTGIAASDGQIDAVHTICHGLASAAAITPVGLNEQGCSQGGIQVWFGVDTNSDGELNLPDEQQMSQVICHGANSLIEAVSLSELTPTGAPEPEEPACPTGGLRVSIGRDGDGDLDLAGEEVQVEHDVCNGLNSTIVSEPIEPSAEGCEYGGFVVRSGIDRNDDRQLSFEEQSTSQVICHGASAKVWTEPIEPMEEGCPNGGIWFQSWTDLDNDDSIDEGEERFARAVCHGSGGLAQVTALEPNPELCPTGGVQVDTGVDDNGDGALDEEEIDATETACYGSNSLVKGTKLGEDPAVCATGGIRVDVGIDDNGDGTLASEEVHASDVVCNGEDSLIRVVVLNPEPDVCPTGGARVESGRDANGNRSLEPSEVKSARTLCNGLSSITRTSTLGRAEEQCAFGGVKIESGLDDNGNRVLEDGEVDSTQVICSGNGLAVRTQKLDVGSMECPSGGSSIESGIDSDGDGALEDGEVQHRDVLCRPSQLLFETKTIAAGDADCPHGGLRVISGHDDGDPGGSIDGELQEEEIELDRKVCLAPTEVQVSGGHGACSTAPGGRAGGTGAWLVLTAVAMLLKRRRRNPAGRIDSASQ